MSKEIERKWLPRTDFDMRRLFWGNTLQHIKDFYFNEYTRIRWQDGIWSITIKSTGTLIRDEYEFILAWQKEEFPYYLEKKRFVVNYKGNNFQINVFKSLDLITIECELDSIDQEIELPEWVGTEITEDKKYYGYNLFRLCSTIN